jgi:predicted phage tail protein
MERFSKYSKEAKENMQALQQQMDKFTKSMEMTKVHSTDLTASLKNVEKTQPFQQMANEPISPAQMAGGVGAGQQNNVTVNLRIDVSGVTDKTDKKALAKEISTMVTKELRTKLGGSMTQSGFNRSG